jgi:hypothetical protein
MSDGELPATFGIVTREHFDNTVTELKALILQTARPAAPAKPYLTTKEVMLETGHDTKRGLYKWSVRWNLAPYARGKYRPEDVASAKSRAALTAGNTVRVIRRKKAA